MTTATREVVERLRALQDLDLQIQRLQEESEQGPARVEGLAQQVQAVDERAAAVEERARVLKAQVRLRENELKGVEQKIERLRRQSAEVRTNKEFVAFRSELANFQAEADRLQGEILKILDVLEQADARLATLAEERALAQARLEQAREKVEGSLEGVRSERDALLARRPERLQGIPRETLEVYERIRKARGQAVALLEGEYCSACMERLTKNDQITVQNATRLIQCRGCNRILVFA